MTGKRKLSDDEVYKLSTREERMAKDRYERVQETARENGGYLGETDLLILSEAVGILVARNERLGLT